MKIAKAKTLDHVDGLLPTRWGVNERHGTCRCESSSGLLPTTEFKFVSVLEKEWCNCDLQLCWHVSYHTIQLERCKRKRRAIKDASNAEVEV